MKIGEPCPFCHQPLVLKRSTAPRQGGRPVYAYCPQDEAAWELEADERYAHPHTQPDRNAA